MPRKKIKMQDSIEMGKKIVHSTEVPIEKMEDMSDTRWMLCVQAYQTSLLEQILTELERPHKIQIVGVTLNVK